MKKAILLLAIGLTIAASRGIYKLVAYFDYQNNIEYSWHLADMASTISQKSEYINKFVQTLEEHKMEGLNAAFFIKNPSKSFNENLKALKSLQYRLNEIKTMDEKGLAYQTAIHQITEQEQGLADSMLENFKDCYYCREYYTLWNPIIIILFFAVEIILIGVGLLMLMD